MKRAVVLALVLLAVHIHAAESGKTFDTNGVTIWYETRGSGGGTPLIIVNGGPGFDHAYLHLGDMTWNQLAKTRTVVFYDQRGNGQSSTLKPGQTCTLADQINDLDALRAHLGFDRIDLLGHSWGGYLVMAYSARHPEHLHKLVIVDSAAPKWSDTRFLFHDIFPETTAKMDALDFADTLGDKTASDASIAFYLTMLFYSPEKREAAMPTLMKSDYHKNVNEMVGADVARFDLNPELPKFNFPTLVITGRYDITSRRPSRGRSTTRFRDRNSSSSKRAATSRTSKNRKRSRARW